MSDFVTPEGRLSFPALFEPKAPVHGAEPKYSATILIPKDGQNVSKDMKRLRALVDAKIAEKWPNANSRPSKLKMAIKDGDTSEFETGANAGKLRKEKYPEMAGCWVITANTTNKPNCIDTSGNAILSPSEVYAGCWVRISLNVFAYDNVNVGIGCGLQNVCKFKDGEPFGNVSRAEDDFSKFINASGIDNDTDGEPEEMGF